MNLVTSEKVTTTAYRGDRLMQVSFTVIKENDFRDFGKWLIDSEDFAWYRFDCLHNAVVSPVSDYIKCPELTVTYIKVVWLSNGRSVTPKRGRGLLWEMVAY